MKANDFWQWVVSRRAGSNARGRFIRETRKLLAEGINPETRLWVASPEAQRQYHDLRRQYLKDKS